MRVYKFPEIEQLRHVIKNVKLYTTYCGRDELNRPIYCDIEDVTLPTLRFHGTTKLHGSNCSIVRLPDGTYYAQSRTRVITPEDDNYGFASWALTEVSQDVWDDLFQQMFGDAMSEKTCILYGEWCGHGIQKGVGICQLPKMFVIFAARAVEENVDVEDSSQWIQVTDMMKLNDCSEYRIYNIYHFKTFQIEIDFSKLKDSVDKLSEYTKEVEDNCPVASQIGSGGCGEGIVWRCVTPGYESTRFWFKTKGEKHKVTKESKRITVDPEKAASVAEFVERTVTEARCLQGIEYIKELNQEISHKSTGQFLRWVSKDILKEESDTLRASGLSRKDVSGPITKAARIWFFRYLDEMV